MTTTLEVRRRQSRAPVKPDLDIAVPPPPARSATHKLVTLGDSLTQGFKSLAICDTGLSWPKILADACGIEFRTPTYPGPDVCPGLPLNLEAMLTELERVTGAAAPARPLHPLRNSPAARDGRGGEV